MGMVNRTTLTSIMKCHVNIYLMKICRNLILHLIIIEAKFGVVNVQVKVTVHPMQLACLKSTMYYQQIKVSHKRKVCHSNWINRRARKNSNKLKTARK